jgi:phosphohistidine phosphatase
VTGKTLLVLRHAKSSWETAAADIDRPLAARGRSDAPAMGAVLRGYKIDLALVSPSQRTRETWELAITGGARAREVRFVRELYGAWAEQVVDMVRLVDEAIHTVLIVGHEPMASDLVLELGAPSELRERATNHFPTCGVAAMTFDGPWATLDDGQAEVVRFETPRSVAGG